MKEGLVFSVTSLDILYLSLSICLIVLTIFLSNLMFRVIKLLKHLNRIGDGVESVLGMTNVLMSKPIQILDIFIDYLGKVLKSGKNK